MKKTTPFKITTLLALVVALLFSGCTITKDGADGAAKSTTVKEPVIGISLPTQREERWVRDKATMEQTAKEMGIKYHMQVADANPAQQAQQVENLLTQGIDVLILAPQDAAASAIMVKKATDAGIPVISYDRLISGTDKLSCYISFDNEKVGEIQGQYFVDNVPAGNIMLFGGAPTDNNAVLFFKGAMSVIQPKIDDGTYTVLGGESFQQVATENWLPNLALNRATAILTANSGKEIHGVLSPNDGVAGGIIQAFKAASVKLPIVTGQDSEVSAVQRIAAGEQSMTVFKDTRETASEAIRVALKLALKQPINADRAVNNGTIEVPSILLPATVVTQENYKEILVESGYIKESDLK